MQTHRMMDPQRLAKTSAASMRSFAAPTELQARQTEATLRMTAAQGSGDRAQWHLWAHEYYTLLSLQPDSARTPSEPVARAQWLQHSLAVGELTAFDPDMKAVNQRNTDAMVGLYQSQTPVESARAVLDASIAVQRYLDQHPDVPALPQTTSAEHRATESLRMLLAVATTTLGAETVARIRTEVLGDETVRGDSFPCSGCGSTLEGEHAVLVLTCPHCGVVTERAQKKSWLQSSLEHWRAGFEQHLGALHDTLADWTSRRPKPDFPGPAPAPLVPPGHAFDATDYAGGVLAPEQALAFLKLLRPSPPTDEIVDFARTIRGAGVQPSANDVLDAVIREYGG